MKALSDLSISVWFKLYKLGREHPGRYYATSAAIFIGAAILLAQLLANNPHWQNPVAYVLYVAAIVLVCLILAVGLSVAAWMSFDQHPRSGRIMVHPKLYADPRRWAVLNLAGITVLGTLLWVLLTFRVMNIIIWFGWRTWPQWLQQLGESAVAAVCFVGPVVALSVCIVRTVGGIYFSLNRRALHYTTPRERA